jgi:CYTH domain-containing protein
MEIERKFLIKSFPPGWRKVPGSRIRQGYFPLCGKALEIRLREMGSQYLLSIKAGYGKIRREEEICVSRRRFVRLWPLVRTTSVVKMRYRIPLKQLRSLLRLVRVAMASSDYLGQCLGDDQALFPLTEPTSFNGLGTRHTRKPRR